MGEAGSLQARARPVGLLDSGVGGLSVLREVRAQLPAEDVIYVADQGHVPYGPRSIEQVREFTVKLARFLIAQDAKLIVVACNTASAAALYTLRELFPDVPFVGMEPAVKPAAHETQTGTIGVIATEATFQGELYASVVGRFAQGVEVITAACPEFVLLAEAGETDSPAAHEAIRRRLLPLAEAGIDQLVLGCTHFPFLKPAIQAVLGPGVTVVDPSAAVARQAGRVLEARGLLNPGARPGHVTYYTSGEVAAFRRVLGALLGEPVARGADVRAACWTEGDAALAAAPSAL
ncbi:MAG: glutamate racemase [Chloroflexi bacterium]|nr:glutamate racemase [Chloroflexota bacterium]